MAPKWRSIETAPKDGSYILLGWFLAGGAADTRRPPFGIRRWDALDAVARAPVEASRPQKGEVNVR